LRPGTKKRAGLVVEGLPMKQIEVKTNWNKNSNEANFLKELIKGYPGKTCQIEEAILKLDLFIEILLKWNKVHNLTAFKNKEEVFQKGILDSLLILDGNVSKNIQLRDGMVIGDIGSGAGFPAVPLAIVLPEIKFLLIEATQKKASFLSFVLAELEISNASIFKGRAEELVKTIKEGQVEPFEVIFSRAAAQMEELAEMAYPMLKNYGKLVIWSSKIYLENKFEGIKDKSKKTGYQFSILAPEAAEKMPANLKTVFVVFEKI
jgi:16S rRNA (guanine527-N7)-methyltransferase